MPLPEASENLRSPAGDPDSVSFVSPRTRAAEAFRNRARKDLLRGVREQSQFLREHNPHMDLPDLVSVAEVLQTIARMHDETRCFLDQEREAGR